MLDTTYRDTRCRISDLMGDLTADHLHTRVPATPAWTVQQLLAHMVGGAADEIHGRPAEESDDDATRRQVGERHDRPVKMLLREWNQLSPAVEARLAMQNISDPSLAHDVICHEADLREALGLDRVKREHWQPFLDVMMRFVRGQLRHSHAVLIRDEHGTQWSCGTGEPHTTLRADGYELLRAAYSRRSRHQITQWDWAPQPHSMLVEHIGYFGPRDDDQPIPAR